MDRRIADNTRTGTCGVCMGKLSGMLVDETLNFWKQNLGALPTEIWEHADVTVLILAGNRLTGISPRIAKFQRLRILDLGHNELVELPDAIGNLVGLSDFLYVHDNRLASLPPSMGRLRKLRYLNISRNLFSIFPDAVCQMSGLIELRANDNQLSNLPDSIAGLANLRELHLRNNRLPTLPAVVGELSELRQIDLRGNPIEVLPEEISRLPKLEKLDLRWMNKLHPTSWLDALQERGCHIYR
jgi:Leucine-rich repeat (LRR) protein